MPEANRLNHTVFFGGNFDYILYAQRKPLFICKRIIYRHNAITAIIFFFSYMLKNTNM